ncbi:MAG: HEAT repeat domain-containing protein, partial [Candidatus Binatia bacterium]
LLVASFLVLGSVTLGLWQFLNAGQSSRVLLFAVRAWFYGAMVLSSVQFWLLASDIFSNFEAKRRFPLLVASGILGTMAGSYFVSLSAPAFEIRHFILVWGLTLLLIPFILAPFFKHPEAASTTAASRAIVAEETDPTKSRRTTRWLVWALFLFWMIYSFFSYGMDYAFNLKVKEHFPDEHSMTQFFGKVGLVANTAVLLYQVLVASPLAMRYGIDRTILFIPFLFLLSMILIYFHPSLLAVAFAEGVIFYFSDYAAEGALNPISNVFSQKNRSWAKMLSEGAGRPVGTLLLLFVGLMFGFDMTFRQIVLVMLGVSAAFLFFPLVFRKIYFRHLKNCLHAPDLNLVANAIQALGERQYGGAVGDLRSLLKESSDISLQRNILVSLGKIQNRETIKDIVGMFRTKNESLQMGVVESLG